MNGGGAVAIACLAIALAGCSGAADPPSAPDEAAGVADLAFEGEGGIIRGLVTNTEFEPLGDALASLDEATQVTTDAQGRFEFVNVPPGEHRVVVQALGYQGIARSVVVEPGVASEVAFELVALRIEEPVHNLIINEGFVCFQVFIGGLTVTYGGLCPGEGSIFLPFEVRKELETIVAEMVWTPSSALTAKVFYLGVWQGGTRSGILDCEHCYAEETGPSPVIARSDGPFEGLVEDVNMLENAIFTRADDAMPGGLNIVYQQRTTVYNSVFYGAKAPEGFSGIPDA